MARTGCASPSSARISLAAVSFGHEMETGELTRTGFLDAARELGFDAVELCDLSLGEPAEAAAELRERSLAMPSIAVRNDFTGTPEEERASAEHVARWLRVAGWLGCRALRVWTGSRRADLVAARQVLEAFDRLAGIAGEVGVTMAVETHGGLSNEPAFLERLCARHPRQVLGVCVDFGNVPAASRMSLIRRLAPLTVHAHVKSYAFDAEGRETSVPLDRVIAALRDAGFAGQWVVEYEGAPPYCAGIERTVAVLRASLEGRVAR